MNLLARSCFLSALLGPAAGLLTAQTIDFDRSTPATLGATANLVFSGANPNKAMAFGFSRTAGPIPLSLMFGGSDPRNLELGVEFASLWLFTSTGTGSGTIPLPIPNNASLAGVSLNTQLLTATGLSTFIDQLSNRLVVQTGASNTATTLSARLGDGQATPSGRALSVAVPIAGSEGEFILVGGGTGNILGATGLRSTEIFSSRTLSIRPGPNMIAPRALNTCTPLKDGRILVAGGVDNMGDPVDTAEIYDPKTNSFANTGKMTVARAGHAAALLNDGRVLVVAGSKELSDVAKVINGLLKSAEIYDPATGTWSATSSISESVLAPALTTLANGQVLVSGGARITRGLFNLPVSVDTVKNCELFDPSTGNWTSTGNMVNHRGVHSLNTILLSDGRVLVTGGIEVGIGLIPPPTTFSGAKATAACEVYNPGTGTWASLPMMPVTRSGHTVEQLGSGDVLIAGGASGSLDQAVSTNSVQVFRPSSNSFTTSFQLGAARATHCSALLPDGTVVLFGGSAAATAPAPLRSIERIHP